MPLSQDTYRHTHLTSDQMIAYLMLQYSNEERHEIEQHLLNCPLCQDAMDGFETMNVREIEMDLDQIQLRLEESVRLKKFNYKPIAIAAGISVLLVSIFFSYQFYNNTMQQKGLAMENEKEVVQNSFEDTSEVMEVTEEVLESVDEDLYAIQDTEETTLEEPPVRKIQEKISPSAAAAPNEKMEVITPTAEAVAAVKPQEKGLLKATNEENLAVEEENFSAIEEDMAFGDGASDESLAMDEVIEKKDAPQRMKATGAVVSASHAETMKKLAAPETVISDSTRNENIVVETTEEVSEIPDVKTNAMPFDGLNAYTQLISANLVYPEEALENQISGDVVLSFNVARTGQIENIKVVTGIGSGCDEEAKRLIQDSGRWKPATLNNEPIEATTTFTVVFKIPEE
ncbi:MAG: energy transducer TonB [Reichenbachiella sp.]